MPKTKKPETETKHLVAALKAENTKLQKRVAKLEAENFSLKARIKATEKQFNKHGPLLRIERVIVDERQPNPPLKATP